MEMYKDAGGNSGIRAYELGYDSVLVQFSDSSTYEYTSDSAGHNNLALMRNLAIQGSGLNSFINRNVKFKYSRKIR